MQTYGVDGGEFENAARKRDNRAPRPLKAVQFIQYSKKENNLPPLTMVRVLATMCLSSLPCLFDVAWRGDALRCVWSQVECVTYNAPVTSPMCVDDLPRRPRGEPSLDQPFFVTIMPEVRCGRRWLLLLLLLLLLLVVLLLCCVH